MGGSLIAVNLVLLPSSLSQQAYGTPASRFSFTQGFFGIAPVSLGLGLGYGYGFFGIAPVRTGLGLGLG